MPNYKLIYFPAKGRAETIRLAFTLAGIPFEDERIVFKDWAALKPKIPTGQLPCLDIDGKLLGESLAIARYVAKVGGLASKCDFEQAKIDEIVEIVNNLYGHAIKYQYGGEGAVKEELGKALKEKHIPETIKVLETLLGDKTSFVNDKVNLADLHFFSVFGSIKEIIGCDSQCCGKLKVVWEKVANEPKIAAYLKKRDT